MNIVAIPFHDWRKIKEEGARTRDAHIINEFDQRKNVEKILVINRPTTLLEIIAKKQKKNIVGATVLSQQGMKLVKVSDKIYVLDYISNDYIGLVTKKLKWIFDKFENKRFINFYKKALDYLKINEHYFISNNVFSARFCIKVNTQKYVFDAYDNLVLFPKYSNIKNAIESLYVNLQKDSNCVWVTNSITNQEYYKHYYHKSNVPIIPNAVDIQLLQKNYEVPEDLKPIPKPWIGFGGKITHLIDSELFDYIIRENPNFSFVIVGKVLDATIINKLTKHANVYYLGDKHYDQYLQYATNFDIAIIPYVTGEKDTGANTIKAYEFLAAETPVIGTIGNGLQELEQFVYLAENKEKFSELVKTVSKPKSEKKLPETYTWKHNVDKFLAILT